MGMTRREREEVVRQFRAFTARHGRLPARKLPSTLYARILRAFGSLAAAREALSIEAPRRGRKWTRQRVVEELRKLRGEVITWRVLDEEHPRLAGAVRSHFGSLVAARRAAAVRGPDSRKGRSEPKWDADLVIAEIKRRHRAGESLATRDVRYLPGGLWRAAERHCGSWRAAIELAGFDYQRIRLIQRYDVDQIASAVRALAARRPRLHVDAFRRDVLGRAALRRYGSIARMRTALGLDHWPVERRHAVLTRADLQARFRRRVDAGKAVTAEALRQDDPQVVTALLRIFGSWTAGLRALRIPHDERVTWTRSLVIEHLRERIGRGQLVTDHALHDEDPRLYGAAQRLFGSRSKAVDAATLTARTRR
jgi:hypothetical protein